MRGFGQSRTILLAGFSLASVLILGCDIVKPPSEPVSPQKPVLRRSDEPAALEPTASTSSPIEQAVKPRPPLWEQVLGASEAKLPPPRDELVWFDDLHTAIQAAAAEKRPILVVARCPDARQSGDIEPSRFSPDSETGMLLRQFVTVRLENAWRFDYRLLESDLLQDPDCTEWIWFLSESGSAISCYGGRHSAESSSSSLQGQGFAKIAHRVLEHYFDPRRPDWKIDRPSPEPGSPATVRERLPVGYRNWTSRFRSKLAEPACLRCHQAQEILFLQRAESPAYTKASEVLLWPEPEQVGLILKPEGGLEVLEVKKGSPAAAAGLQPGDELGTAFDRRLFSRADLRAVLNSTPYSGGNLSLRWLRGNQLMEGRIGLPRGWRERPVHELSWRASLLHGPLGPIPGFIARPLGDNLRKKLKLPPGTSALEAVVTPNSPALAKGVQPGDVVVAVNGQSPQLDARSWMVWFRINFDAGRPLNFDLISPKNGALKKVSYIPFTYEPTE